MSNLIEKVFVALDNMNKEEIFDFLSKSNDLKKVKIGLELFNKYGPGLVKEIHSQFDVEIFLDLKLHDIPNTVYKAIKSLEGLPVKYLTIHLSGGSEMLKMAKTAKDESLPECKLLGVSILTSLDQSDIMEIWGTSNIEDAFKRLFALAHKNSIAGVICSAKEIPILKSFSNGLISICPGIRFQDEIDSGINSDQKRVLSPKDAIKIGADYLVMGRSLTQAKDLQARLNSLKSAK